MESTWEPRDLPVLDAVVHYFEEHGGSLRPHVADIADLTGISAEQVARAAQALDPAYLKLQMMGGGPGRYIILGITDEARRAVGQWPSPEAVADRIVAELLEAANQEPDEGKRTKLRAAAETLGSFGRDLLVNVAANLATKPIGL
jgi:hypothetical protein